MVIALIIAFLLLWLAVVMIALVVKGLTWLPAVGALPFLCQDDRRLGPQEGVDGCRRAALELPGVLGQLRRTRQLGS